MSTMSLSVTDAARNFSEYVNRVNYRGDRFVLVKGGRDVAELKPVPKGRLLSELASLLKSSARLNLDEVDSFEADLDAARSEMNHQEVRNPWDS